LKTLSKILIFTLLLQLINISTFAVNAATTMSIADARAEATGVEVTIEGIVTHVNGKNLFVQDDTAAIIVRSSDYTSYNVGDKVSATGSRAEYYDMSQISADIANITLVQANAGVPEAQVISSTDLTSANGEAYEAELVTIMDVTVSSVDTYSNYTASDANGSFVISSKDSLVMVDDTYTSVTGVIDYNFSEYKLTPRSSEDVVGGTSIEVEVTLSTVAEARVNEGSKVLIQGIVTAGFDKGKMNYYVQDDTAGIIVRVGGLDLKIGDKISAEGTVESYYGMQQISANAEDIKVIEEKAGVPAAKFVTSADFGESIEGQFVKIASANVGEANQYGEYAINDANGTIIVQPAEKEMLEAGITYDVIYGVVEYSYGAYKLIPRNKYDAVEDIYGVISQPEEERIVTGSTVELMTNAESAKIYYTVDGSEPTTDSTLYTGAITINQDTTIKAVVVTAEHTGEVYEFSYISIESFDGLSIHDIQGASHVSPYEGLAVTDVQGIVTSVEKNGFYMQEPNADNDIRTSEGIYVNGENSGLSVGDLVSVDGMVKEIKPKGYSDANDLLTTQIDASDITVKSTGNTLPEAVLIGKDGRVQPSVIIDNDGMLEFDPEEDGLDFYEALEGMLVSVKDGQVIAPPKYGEIAVYIDNGQEAVRTPSNGLLITPEDLNPERLLIFSDAKVKVGDRFDGTITGVITYTYSNFKLQPTIEMPAVIDGEYTQEITSINSNADDLTIATYNVENYSAETSDEKTLKIAKSIINNLKNPDIIGLVEVQDNDGPNDSGVTDASESYQKLIDAIIAEGGPTYAFTEIAPEDKADGGQPGGNIRVGFIYNVDRVSLVEKPKGDATTSVAVDANGSLTLNPGRIAPTSEAFEGTRKSLAAEFEFNGEKVIVIVNHFNSKRGDDAPFGAKQPTELGSEVKRMKMATAVNNFVKEIMAANQDANVVVVGDMNDFEFSNPLTTLKGDVLTNMIETLTHNERYTYVYQGNSQVLDHILVSNNISSNTTVDIVHLNSEFSEEDGRASDHDPILIKMSFEEKTAELPNTASNHYNFIGLGIAMLMISAFLLYRKKQIV
jgi:uncharacterized protein